uniref:Small ribosomal subunit protein mS29 n=1 Tax=Branchiostoma floridae TaxID=7739 RepID=C3Y275_BRAFL|eukprot:XP_002609955.1 hypothetical protein BRAFLDRAFT_124381 [Branchiostoma floridae]
MAAPMKIFRELSRKDRPVAKSLCRHWSAKKAGKKDLSMFCQPCGKQTVHYARASSVAASTEPSAQTREPVPQPPPVRSIFRTPVSNPVNHGLEQEAQFYTIPPDEYKTMFPQDHGMPSRFKKQGRTYFLLNQVLCLILNINTTDGIRGTGKTLCLCHVLHYCTKQGWVVLFFPKVSNWVKNVKEIQPSFHNPERYDQPLEAVAWLKTFKVSAADSIKERGGAIVTAVKEAGFLGMEGEKKDHRRYTRHEDHPDIYHDILDHVSARPQTFTPEALLGKEGFEYIDPYVPVLVEKYTEKEIESCLDYYTDRMWIQNEKLVPVNNQYTLLHRIRLLVAVDGVNSLFGRTVVRKPDRSMAYASELSLTYNLRKLVRNDWRGGAIVTAVKEAGFLGMEGEKKDHRRYTRHEDHPDIYHDILDHVSARPQTFTPEALLGKEGFEYMDPYVPVLVEKYTEKEIESCLDYYTDRMWIQNEKCWTEAGRQQLKFLSGYEPADLERICGPL